MCVWCLYILFWLVLLNCIHFFFISSWISPGNFLLIRATLSQNVLLTIISGDIFRIQDLGEHLSLEDTISLWWTRLTMHPCVFMQLFIFLHHNLSLQFTSVAQSCLTLCDTMDCSTPGLPLHHKLPERAQTHVHWVSDVIQPSHSLSSSFPPAFNLSQH